MPIRVRSILVYRYTVHQNIPQYCRGKEEEGKKKEEGEERRGKLGTGGGEEEEGRRKEKKETNKKEEEEGMKEAKQRVCQSMWHTREA